uniref:Uncharacterized protein n=1 Tax=Cacopsylla melanoneura TaxID=428564 RepID=A0A8D8PRB9_9HEMI
MLNSSSALASISSAFSLASCSMKAIMCLICFWTSASLKAMVEGGYLELKAPKKEKSDKKTKLTSTLDFLIMITARLVNLPTPSLIKSADIKGDMYKTCAPAYAPTC